MNSRLKTLVSLFDSRGIDACLVVDDPNIRYLTDFPASESWLFVTPQKSYYITDFRYILAAEKGLKGVALKEHSGSRFQVVLDLAQKHKVKKISFDAHHLSYFQFQQMFKMCPKTIKLLERNGLVEELRMCKDVDEIKKIRQALALHKKTYQYLKRVIRPGKTEREILFALENFVKPKGAGFSFSPIIASGPNSCFPHASVTDRKIRNNEPLMLDMGIDLNGYKSDLTRMFLLGRISKLVANVNDTVQEAQLAAIDRIKPGVAVADVDQQARKCLERKKLAKYFGHALGHGVGLEIHEAPRLSQKDPAVLKEGMVITVEPAVYLPNQFGIRIEDMVLVTKKGCEVLSADIH